MLQSKNARVVEILEILRSLLRKKKAILYLHYN